MKVERLERMAQMLERSGPYSEEKKWTRSNFNLGIWFYFSDSFLDTQPGHIRRKLRNTDSMQGVRYSVIKQGSEECGFAACACGHAAVDPWFRKRNFPINLGMLPMDEWFGFDLYYTTISSWLFSPGSYYPYEKTKEGLVPPRLVAKRIRLIIKHKGNKTLAEAEYMRNRNPMITYARWE